MPTVSSVLLVFQGLPILLFGATILYDPVKANFGDVPASVAHVIGFANISLGVSYLMSSLQSRRTRHHFLLGTIPVRLAAGWVFQRDGADARGAPIWDYGNALVDVGVLVWEGWGGGMFKA